MNDTQTRQRLIEKLGNTIAANLSRPELCGKAPIRLEKRHDSIGYVAGPRTGSVEFAVGLDSKRLVDALSSSDMALLKRLVPEEWEVPRNANPMIYMNNRRVRVEIAWPNHLQEKDVTLSSIATGPRDGRRFIVGVNERGATITATFDNETPHWLVGGTTGSGKTCSFQTIVCQVSQNKHARQILLDGKFGEGLTPLDGIPGQIGRVITNTNEARNALGFAYNEMVDRYQRIASGEIDRESLHPFVVDIDEVQSFTSDTTCNELINIIAAQGRAANLHLLLGTQYPTKATIGDTNAKQNLTGRLALATCDYVSSQAVIGRPSPRADYLLGCGDAYVVQPSVVHRVQCVYIPRQEIESFKYNPTTMEDYFAPNYDDFPEFDSTRIGAQQQSRSGRSERQFNGREIALAILHVANGGSKRDLISALKQRNVSIGANPSYRLFELAREADNVLREEGY